MYLHRPVARTYATEISNGIFMCEFDHDFDALGKVGIRLEIYSADASATLKRVAIFCLWLVIRYIT